MNLDRFARRVKDKLKLRRLPGGLLVKPLPEWQLDAIFSYPHPKVMGRELPDDPKLFEMLDWQMPKSR